MGGQVNLKKSDVNTLPPSGYRGYTFMADGTPAIVDETGKMVPLIASGSSQNVGGGLIVNLGIGEEAALPEVRVTGDTYASTDTLLFFIATSDSEFKSYPIQEGTLITDILEGLPTIYQCIQSTIKPIGSTLKLPYKNISGNITLYAFFPIGYTLEAMLVTNTTGNVSSSPQFGNNDFTYFAAPASLEAANRSTFVNHNPVSAGTNDSNYYYTNFLKSVLFDAGTTDLIVTATSWNGSKYNIDFYLRKLK